MRNFSKFILGVALVVISTTTAIARDRRDSLVTNTRFVSNTFVQSGLGMNFTATPSMAGKFNAQGNFLFDFNLGKWISPYVGMRIGYQGFHFTDWESSAAILDGANKTPGVHDGKDMYTVRLDYSYVHADIMYNILQHLLGYKEYRRFEISPYAHLGYEWLYNAYAGPKYIKGDYTGGVGLLGTLRINNRLAAFADYRTSFMIRHTTNVAESAYQMGWSVGLQYDFTEPTWKKIGQNSQLGYGLSRFVDNTFVGIGGGLANYLVPAEKAGWNAIAQPIGDIYVGKWFTPSVGARLGFSVNKMAYWSGHNEFTAIRYTPGFYAGRDMYKAEFMFYQVHGDLMWNICNAFGGYYRDRRWDCIPYLSLSAAMSSNMNGNDYFRRDFFGGVGLLNNLMLTKHFGLNLDLRTYYLSERRFGTSNTDPAFIAEALLGTTYTFGNVGWNTYRSAVRERRHTTEAPNPVGFIINSAFIDNTFVSLYAGVNGMATPAAGLGFNSRVTPSMDVAFGKMISPSFGVRFGIQGAELSQFGTKAADGVGTFYNKDGKLVETAGYIHPHVDVLFDMMTIIGKYNPDRFYTLLAYPHLGYVGMFSQDNSDTRLYDGNVGIGAGILNRFRLSERIDIDFDLNWTATPAALEADAPFTHIMAAQVGLAYNMGATTWVHSTDRAYSRYNAPKRSKKNVSGYVLSNKFFDNTFVSVMAGVNLLSDSSLGLGYNARPALALDITAGKWFVPYLGVRLGYQGRNISEWGASPSEGTYGYEAEWKGQTLNRESVGYNYFHVDAMTDLMHMFAGYKKTRVFSLDPYVSAGLVYLNASNGDSIGSRFGLGGGMLGSFKVAERLGLNIDLRATKVIDPIVDEASTGKEVVLSSLVGMTYRFGNTGWATAVVPTIPDETDDKKAPARRWAISTNLLGYADLGTINIEAQYALNRHFSVDMQAKSNAWKFKAGDGFLEQKSVANVGVKYWPWYVYSGLWFKGAVQAANYSYGGIFKNRTPERGDSYGLVTAGGYSLIICPWMNIDFGLGIWGGYRDYRRYENVQMDSMKYHNGSAFLGLSEASVSLMFVF